ncbi:MAG: hypothetical protein Hals2KO_28290 [Halioglobus sp.]
MVALPVEVGIKQVGIRALGHEFFLDAMNDDSAYNKRYVVRFPWVNHFLLFDGSPGHRKPWHCSAFFN